MPTPELSRQRTIIPRLRANQGYSMDLYVVDGSGPDRLLLAGKIDTNQHATLLSFTVILHRARMLGPKGPAMERVTNSDPANSAQKMGEALARVGRIYGYLDRRIGVKARRELVDLCMQDWEPEGAIEASVAALRDALDI
jgi:hypothetical protein